MLTIIDSKDVPVDDLASPPFPPVVANTVVEMFPAAVMKKPQTRFSSFAGLASFRGGAR